MKQFGSNIANLFKVKTLITLGIIGAMCYGFLKGLITSEMFAAIAGSVVTYYFTKKGDGDGKNGDNL